MELLGFKQRAHHQCCVHHLLISTPIREATDLERYYGFANLTNYTRIQDSVDETPRVSERSSRVNVRRVLRYMTFHLRSLTMFAIGEHGDTLTMLYGLDLPHLESLKMLIQPRGSGYFLADLVEDPCRSIQMPHLETFALVMSTRGCISLIWDVIKIMVSSCD
jgi:hypothetical protein